jgi:hypothetical protein
MLQYRFYAFYVIFLTAINYAITPLIAATRQSNGLTHHSQSSPLPPLQQIAPAQMHINYQALKSSILRRAPQRVSNDCSHRNAVSFIFAPQHLFLAGKQPAIYKFGNGFSPPSTHSPPIGLLASYQNW